MTILLSFIRRKNIKYTTYVLICLIIAVGIDFDLWLNRIGAVFTVLVPTVAFFGWIFSKTNKKTKSKIVKTLIGFVIFAICLFGGYFFYRNPNILKWLDQTANKYQNILIALVALLFLYILIRIWKKKASSKSPNEIQVTLPRGERSTPDNKGETMDEKKVEQLASEFGNACSNVRNYGYLSALGKCEIGFKYGYDDPNPPSAKECYLMAAKAGFKKLEYFLNQVADWYNDQGLHNAVERFLPERPQEEVRQITKEVAAGMPIYRPIGIAEGLQYEKDLDSLHLTWQEMFNAAVNFMRSSMRMKTDYDNIHSFYKHVLRMPLNTERKKIQYLQKLTEVSDKAEGLREKWHKSLLADLDGIALNMANGCPDGTATEIANAAGIPNLVHVNFDNKHQQVWQDLVHHAARMSDQENLVSKLLCELNRAYGGKKYTRNHPHAKYEDHIKAAQDMVAYN